jgi:serine/threonine-protein kinase HipA
VTLWLLDASLLLAREDIDDVNLGPAQRLLDRTDPVATVDLAFYRVGNVAIRAWRDAGAGASLIERVTAIAGAGGLVRVDGALLTSAGPTTGLAAKLRRKSEGTEFAYLEDYLANGGPAVASTLPLSDVNLLIVGGAVPPFFAGLLPEGRRLSGLIRRVKTSPDDEFSLVIVVGSDPIGDVQIVPEGEVPGSVEPLIVAEKSFEEIRFADALADVSIFDASAIPGVQDKASAGVISVPLSAKGNRYILKVDPPDYPHVVANEHYFLRLAKEVGLNVVEAELVIDADRKKGRRVQRLDRVAGPPGATQAIACEDACQLLGLRPGSKYTVTSEAATIAIGEACFATPPAIREVFRQLCFAWLTGNGDVHAKNLTVLESSPNEFAVSPAYDLSSTVIYHNTRFAMSLAGKREGFSRRQFPEFASSVGSTGHHDRDRAPTTGTGRRNE